MLVAPTDIRRVGTLVTTNTRLYGFTSGMACEFAMLLVIDQWYFTTSATIADKDGAER